jgi:hypothetical protein
MAMPECVPADATYPHLHCCGDKPIHLHTARPIQFAFLWISEYPILDVRTRSKSEPVLAQYLVGFEMTSSDIDISQIM